MRVPLSWLREWAEVPVDTTPEAVHEAFVSVGFEEEDVHGFGLTGPIVVGRVIEFVEEPQSNGKTIRWCQVDVGEAEPRGIVCGAGNFHPGDKVVVTLPGAVLPGPFPIAARKTYGHVSDGMIASAKELGLGQEHSGILRLVELGLDPEPGTDAIALLGLDDVAVEVNVTPDRGYAFSVRGLAREYAHATGTAFVDPAAEPGERGRAAAASGFEVVLHDEAPIRGRRGAVRFVARAVEGLDASRPTPAAIIARLSLAGIRSISLAVDVTNYVMLELGQPIHGYDLDALTDGITVRRAAEGETLETLDGQTRSLHVEDLLITDGSGPIGLAGVMGGASTEISATTTRVLIEAAVFDPVSIARTARRHKLPSEASKRFERGVDPRVAEAAAQRVVDLLIEHGGARAVDLGAVVGEAPAREAIAFPHGFTDRIVGVTYAQERVQAILEEIGCAVEANADALLVTPPSWRPDLAVPVDLAEEVARIDGYDRIPSILPTAPSGRGLTREQVLRRRSADALAAAGLVEVLCFPFQTAAEVALFDGDAPTVKLANPLDGQAPLLRRSLLPGLIGAAHRNLARGTTDLALFEIGNVFLPGEDDGIDALPAGAVKPSDEQFAAIAAGIPEQPRRLAVLLTGAISPKQPGQEALVAGLGDALAAIDALGVAVGAELTTRQAQRTGFHPGRTAELLLGGEVVGVVGELLPALAEAAHLPKRVAAAEVDLDAVLRLAPAVVQAVPLSTQTAATQDLSLVVPAELPAAEVIATVVEGAGELLEHARLVDDYRGQGVGEGEKSLTLALRFRAEDRTLTAAEASAAKDAGAALAAQRHGAAQRE